MRSRSRIIVAMIVTGGTVALVSGAMLARYVRDVDARVGPPRPVVVLRSALPAMRQVSPDVIRTVSVPDRWRPVGALGDPGKAIGLVTRSALPAGTLLQRGMLVAPPALTAGERAVTIVQDTAVAGAGVRPGSRVDVNAAFPARDGVPAAAEVVVAGARVLDVGPTNDHAGGFEGLTAGTVAVTLALAVEDALAVTYAQSFAASLQVAVVPMGAGLEDRDPVAVADPGRHLRAGQGAR